MSLSKPLTYILTTLILIVVQSGCGGSNDETDNTSGHLTQTDNVSEYLALTGHTKYDESKFFSYVISADDTHLYAVVTGGKANSTRLAKFTADEESSTYLYAHDVRQDINQYTRLSISPDGYHLYAITYEEITTYSIDGTTGDLTLSSSLGREMIDDMFYPRYTLISPDGKYIYIHNGVENHIHIFNRTPASGELTYLGKQEFYDRYFLKSMTISHDNKTLYMITDETIYVSSIDVESGFFTLTQSFVSTPQSNGEFVRLNMVADITIAENDSMAYIYGEIDYRDSQDVIHRNMGLLIVDRNIESGELSYNTMTIIPDTKNYFSQYNSSKMSLSNGFVYVMYHTRYGASDMGVILGKFNISSTGEYEQLKDREELNCCSGFHILPSNSGKHILVLSGGKLTQLDSDLNTGLVINARNIKVEVDENDGLQFANYSIVSPDGQYLYVLAAINGNLDESDQSITVYKISTNTGEINYLQRVFLYSHNFFPEFIYTVVGSQTRSNVMHGALSISPDGRFLYLIGGGKIVRLNVNASTGHLSRSEGFDSDILDLNEHLPYFKLESITLSPDGMNVYAAGIIDNNAAAIVIISRDIYSGQLNFDNVVETKSDYTFGTWKPLVIQSSRDGNNIYLANQYDSSLFSYRRDTNNGMLSFLEKHQSMDFIDISSISFSNDERYMYASADEIALYPGQSDYFYNNVSMLVFARDPVLGSLTLIQKLEKGGEDASGNLLDRNVIQGGVRQAISSPNSDRIYALTQKQRSVYEAKINNGVELSIYEINSDNGKLSLIEQFDQEYAGLGISYITASPDGEYIFVTNERRNTLTVLEVK